VVPLPDLSRVLLLFLGSVSVAFGDELRVDYMRQSLTATYTHYQQFIEGVPVVGGERIEGVDRDGHRFVSQSLARRSEGRVIAAAVTPLAGEPVYLNVEGQAIAARRVVVEERPRQPYARYYDVTTGALLRSDPLFWSAQGRVFDPNPVARLNMPSLQDQNDSAAAVPEAAYSIVDLPGLPASGMLIGPNVRIVDTDPPFTTHADASQSLMFDRSQPQFEEVNAYFHIDRSQRYMQSLGYTGARQTVSYSIPVDPHALSGADNSFYVSQGGGVGALFFGDGGTDDAEDSDIMLHEYGHAIQDSIAPGAFGGSSASQSRALAEGWSDYWSFSTSYAATIASGRDPSCIGDWDARCWNDDSSQECGYPVGADCLRRVDGRKTMSDYVKTEVFGIEHSNGEIFSSAMREIFLAVTAVDGIEQGKRLTDTILLEATFGTPLNPTFASMARRLLDADARLTGGANARTICSAMTVRGVLAIGDCDQTPRGEVTWFPSADAGQPIANSLTAATTVNDSRPIDSLSVAVAIDGVPRGDLQIALIAPDGTRVALQNTSGDRMAGVHTTYGVTTLSAEPLDALRGRSASGTWTLAATDIGGSGAGVLISWALVIRFAGDEPLTTRPLSVGERREIAAVAHAPGVNGTNFVSDVQIFNGGASTANVTAIFTPSGADGTTNFAAMKLEIAPQQVVALNDVVTAVMQAAGTGQLDFSGDVENLIVSSRTYNSTAAGTFGQSIPSISPDEAIGAGDLATITLLRRNIDFRSNIGFAEVAGRSGTARFTFLDSAGNTVGTADYPVVPFSHFQTALLMDAVRADVTMIGNGRIAAYGSVVDNHSSDGMYIPAARALAAERVVPAVHSQGLNGTFWRTDIWTTTGLATTLQEDVVPAQTFVPLFITAAIAGSRTWTPTDNGSCGEFIPVMPTSVAIHVGESPLQLIGIEQSVARRTNIGVINVDRAAPVGVRVTVYDGGGRVRGRFDQGILPAQMFQIPLSAISAGSLQNGRVTVEAFSAGGAAVAYASVVDNRSGDSYVVIGRKAR